METFFIHLFADLEPPLHDAQMVNAALRMDTVDLLLQRTDNIEKSLTEFLRSSLTRKLLWRIVPITKEIGALFLAMESALLELTFAIARPEEDAIQEWFAREITCAITSIPQILFSLRWL